MSIISAFVGRSFGREEDKDLWRKIEEMLNSLKEVGFSWEDAEVSEARSISDKVREKINKNDIFIGILTKRQPIYSAGVSLGEWHFFAKTIDHLTSYWVIQESGYALGKEKKVIFLKEEGLSTPDGLNADSEWISLNRYDLHSTTIKLNEIICNEINKKAGLSEGGLSDRSAIVHQDSAVEEQAEVPAEQPNLIEAVGEAISNKEYSVAEEKFKEILESEKCQDEGFRRMFTATYYRVLYLSGREDAFDRLKEVADENPEDYYAVECLTKCLEYYDRYENAKEVVESYLNKVANYNTKLRLSILLSTINVKRREFRQAKDSLYPFLEDVSSNTNSQNFDIFRTLGNIYKSEEELDICCSMYEMALEYEPTVSSIRFSLAYDYGELKKYALSLYHYKAHLKTDESAHVMNNLGVSYGYLGMLGKSVESYKEAGLKGNTLANANLASDYIQKGFYTEAKDILTQAVKKEEHHERVDYRLSELKDSIRSEVEKEELVLKDAKEHRQFILDFAKATSVPFIVCDQMNGAWVSDYSGLDTFEVRFVPPDILEGKHEVEYPYYLSALESQERIKKTVFSGTVINRGIKYSIKVSSYPKDVLPFVEKEEIPEFSGFGFLVEDGQAMELTAEKDGKTEFFTAQRKKND